MSPSSSSIVRSLIGLQVLSRGGTFALNQALVRLASPTAFGAAAIQFELVLSTILFLSREGVRTALLRAPSNAPGSSAARRANTAFLPVVIGVPLSLATALLYYRVASAEVHAQSNFAVAIGLYALAAVLELLSEPLYNVAMTTLQTGVRVRAEGLGIAAKSLVTFGVLFYDHRFGYGTLALVAFATGQLAYSLVVFATYVATLGTAYMRPKVPARDAKKGQKNGETVSWKTYLDAHTVQLAGTLTLQSIVKHFLTEGDKLILAWFSPLSDQGGYAIAVNYGSLVARILFQPIEETLRLFFSRLLPSTSTPSSSARTRALTTLQTVLSLQIAASLLLLVFAPPYLPLLLPLLLPTAYLSTSAPRVLAAWVWYIPVLAMNGVLEAFLASVARPNELNSQSRWMVFFSGVYVSAAILLYRIGCGDASLVYANIVNLTVRIIYCLQFARNFFSTFPKSSSTQKDAEAQFTLSPLLPPASYFLALLLSRVLITLSANRTRAVDVAARLGRRALLDPHVLAHIGVGGALAGICGGLWWWTRGRALLSEVRRASTSKAKTK